MQQSPTQEHRILKYYIDNLWKEKTFRILKDTGFVDMLANRTLCANANFDTFLSKIDSVAKDQEYLAVTSNDMSGPSGNPTEANLDINCWFDCTPYHWIDCYTFIWLKDEWVREIETIRPCVDCYEHWTTHETNSDYMTSVCSRPHLLVYARDANTADPRMWPAKVISVYNRGSGNSMVTIDFFGECSRAEYAFAECFLYSNAQEIERKKANAKYSRNSRIKKQKEYRRSFAEVTQYIKNVDEKFGFVPAATKMALTDYNQHLRDMFPRAFTRSPIVRRKTVTPAEETDNVAQDLPAGQATNSRSNRMASTSSQGYVSRASSAYDMDERSTCDKDEDVVDRKSAERAAIDIKFEVSENVTQYSAKANDNSQSGETEREVDSIKGESLDGSAMGAEEKCKESGKRSAVTTEHSVRKKVALANGTAIIKIDSDSDNDGEITSTSAQNPNPVNRGNFDVLLDEFADVKTKIWKNQKQQKTLKFELIELKQQEDIMKAKLRNSAI